MRGLFAAVALSACQPPAPAIDEERLARRVADMLAERFAEDGTCRPRGQEGSGDEQDANAETPGESSNELQRQVALAAIRAEAERLSQLAERLPPSEPALPTAELAADRRASVTGDEAHRRTCIPLPGDTPALGPERASVTIVALLDPQCPFCAALYPRLLRAQRAFASDVRLAVLLQPVEFHREAPRASMALREVYALQRSEGFFSFLSRVYSNPRDLSLATLVSYAEERNIDAARFREAVEDRRHATTVATSVALANSTHSRGTPAMFINGRLVPGAVHEEIIGGVVQEELARARRLRRTVPASRFEAALCVADGSTTASTPARPMEFPRPPDGDTQ